jgi:hypothetical protein
MPTFNISEISARQLIQSHSALNPERKGLSPSFRRKLFLHQDGFILTMVVGALQEKALLDMFLDRWALTVGEITRRISINRGYLHVAMRCLAQQGWFTRSGVAGTDELSYKITDIGMAASVFFPVYARVAKFLRKYLPLEKSLLLDQSSADLDAFTLIIENATSGWGLRQMLAPPATPKMIDFIRQHLDGNLVVAIMTGLLNAGYLDVCWRSLSERRGLALSLRFLDYLGWINLGRHEWTEEGLIARENVLHYGMVGSYFPMLVDLPRILYGGSVHRTHINPGDVESHVDRRLNVLASGAAHHKYFMDADEIFIDIFNREPIGDQPSFVADCGCGDGSWLKHIYNVVRTRTKRGQDFSQYPLLVIGTDYNEPALEITRRVLKQSSIPSLALFGDVTDPGRLAQDLGRYGIDIRDGLHIRSFIDHNRCYSGTPQINNYELRTPTSGAYVDETGNLIPNRLLEMDLIEFLKRWRPYVSNHGLILLEAHCVAPYVAARHLGDTHNIVFDTYHGFSHQYPADFEAFIEAAEMAGLKAVLYHQRRYPSRKPFVSISINRLLVCNEESPIPTSALPLKRLAEWKPSDTQGIEDGEALHRLLYDAGDINKPKRWCAASTGLLIMSVLRLLNALFDQIQSGKRPPRISIVDYGTGTGLATIEVLRACNETGLIRRLEVCEIDFKIHLLDIPSSWYAKGYQLLKDCPYVSFHSIKSPQTGKFLSMTEILGGTEVDIIIASMVFHLIPQHAIPKLFKGFSEVLNEGGALIWNSPDIGPSNHDSVLFHEPNRCLRKRLLELVECPERIDEILSRLSPVELEEYQSLKARLWQTHGKLTPKKKIAAAAVANRQILPTPTDISYLEEELNQYFSGEVFNKSFEMLAADSVDTMLIPSNQRYLIEIEDNDLRQRLIRLLMIHEIMPRYHDSDAGTAYGFSVHWSFGEHYLRPA